MDEVIWCCRGLITVTLENPIAKVGYARLNQNKKIKKIKRK